MKILITITFLAISSFTYSQINIVDSNGLKQGFWITHGDRCYEIGQYLNGKRSGEWVFYKQKRIDKILSYENDSLSGYAMSFNSNGSLKKRLLYKNGKLNGQAEFYSSEGVLLARYQYLNDNILTVDYYVINKETPPRHHGYVPKIE